MLNSLLLFGTIILCLSIFLLLLLAIRRKRKPDGASLNIEDISLAIPFRDEPFLMDQFKHLQRELEGVITPVFWIDDNSRFDDSELKLQIKREPNFYLLKNESSGKKLAIVNVLKKAKTEWVLLLDADTYPDLDQFRSGKVRAEDHHKMILFPISPIKEKSFLRKLFDIEFLVIQLATHISIFIGRPLLANGAALLVNRRAYLDSLGARSDFHLKSGDDVFAMFAIAKTFGNRSIGTAFPTSKPFKVKFPVGPMGVFNQRSRWISKTPAIRDNWFRLVSLLVLLGNISLLGILVHTFFGNIPLLYVAITGFYLFSASIFAFTAIKDFYRPDLFLYTFPAVLLFPFYLVAIILVTLFKKPVWK